MEVGHASPERPFGCEQREGVSQVESHLSAEFADSPSPSAITLDSAGLNDVLHHVKVLRWHKVQAVVNADQSCCKDEVHLGLTSQQDARHRLE